MRRWSPSGPPRRKNAGSRPSSVSTAVEKHREPELGADPACELEGRLARLRLGLRLERDERNDVGRADAGMCSFVLAEVDPLGRGGDPGEQ